MFKRLMFFACSIFILLGCKKEITNLDIAPINSGIAVPVGGATLKASNISQIGNILVGENADQIMELTFPEAEMYRGNANDYFNVATQVQAGEIILVPSYPFSTVPIFNYTELVVENNDGDTAKMEIFDAKSGQLHITLRKDFDHSVTNIIFTFPDITMGGAPLVMTLDSIPLGDNSDYILTAPLAGYRIDLTKGGLGYNEIGYSVDVTIDDNGVDIPTGNISFDFDVQNPDYSYIQGDFGTFKPTGTNYGFTVDWEETLSPESVFIADPKVNVRVENSYGVPFSITADKITITFDDASTLDLSGPFVGTPQNVAGAESPGDIANTSLVVSDQNVNGFANLFNDINKVTNYYSENTMVGNPDSTVAVSNFALDTSELVIYGQQVIPLYGYADNYELSDTLGGINLDLGIEQGEGVEIDFATIKLKVENAFPFESKIQIIFLDSNDVVLDSLFMGETEKTLISAGMIDPITERVVSATEKINLITITGDKYEGIKNTSKIIIKGSMGTPEAGNGELVKVTSDNYLFISLGIKAGIIIDPMEF